jgi:hypothetical protein
MPLSHFLSFFFWDRFNILCKAKGCRYRTDMTTPGARLWHRIYSSHGITHRGCSDRQGDLIEIRGNGWTGDKEMRFGHGLLGGITFKLGTKVGRKKRNERRFTRGGVLEYLSLARRDEERRGRFVR